MDDDNPNNTNPNPEAPTGGSEPRPESDTVEESVVVEESSSVEESKYPENTNSSQPNPVPMPNSNPSGGDIVFTDKPKKGKAGLIVGIIIALLILGGAGAFIAVYAINSQPENILASSIDKFINAKNISTSGTISLDLDENSTGIDDATLTLGVSTGGNNESGNLSLAVTMADGTKIDDLSVGETLVSDGILYLRFDGLEDLYDKYLSQYIPNYTTVNIVDYSTPNNQTVEVQSTTTTSNLINSYLSDAISKIDGEWFEISIDDVLDSNYISSTMTSSDKKAIKTTYNCVTDTLINGGQKYSKELSNLYGQHKFITMTSGQDSYYNISFAASPLTDFLNAIPSTSLVSDFATCVGIDTSTINAVTVDGDTVEDLLGQLPKVSAKFDGFLSHELSALKISDQNDAYTLNADLKFTYPDSLNISAPENATPIMERIEEILSGLPELEQ